MYEVSALTAFTVWQHVPDQGTRSQGLCNCKDSLFHYILLFCDFFKIDFQFKECCTRSSLKRLRQKVLHALASQVLLSL